MSSDPWLVVAMTYKALGGGWASTCGGDGFVHQGGQMIFQQV